MQNTQFERIGGIVRRRYSKPKRSHNEMMLEMLKCCFNEPKTIGTIMFQANISWRQVVTFADILLGRGLLNQSKLAEHKRVFWTTNEGKEAVFLWNKIRKIFE